jgi:hypothetical protein
MIIPKVEFKNSLNTMIFNLDKINKYFKTILNKHDMWINNNVFCWEHLIISITTPLCSRFDLYFHPYTKFSSFYGTGILQKNSEVNFLKNLWESYCTTEATEGEKYNCIVSV